MKLIKQEYFRESIMEYLTRIIPDVKIFLSDGEPDNDRWVRVKFGDTEPGIVSDTTISLYCCTKDDDEYLKLASLVDDLTEFIQESNYIPYEQAIPEAPYWEKVMDMRITSVMMSDDMTGADDTKIKVIMMRITMVNA